MYSKYLWLQKTRTVESRSPVQIQLFILITTCFLVHLTAISANTRELCTIKDKNTMQLHPALTSDWSINSSIMVVYENF